MARRNASFEQILRHYYRGVVIARMEMEPATVEQAPTLPPVETTDESKVRTRPRKTLPSDVTPKPRRRVTRRAVPRPIPEPARLPSTLEAPTRPAAGVLKRVQVESSREEKVTPNLIVPDASATPKEEPPAQPRVELDLPIRPTAPAETRPTTQWQLPKPEPIEATRPAPTPPPADETPSMIGRRMHVDHLPGARMICGALPRADIVILIENPRGESSVVYSGTAPQYGVGGFEFPVAENGKYIVTIGGQSLAVQVQDDTAFIQA